MKKILFLVGVLAALCTSFTLTSCGGGASDSDTMSMGDFARGAKEFQLLPNNGMVGEIFATPGAGPTTTLPHGSSIDDAESVTVYGYYRAGGHNHPMIYTYKKLDDTQFSLSFSHLEETTAETVAFIQSLGFGTNIKDDDGGTNVGTNIDSVSGLKIEMLFDMVTHTVYIESSMTIADEETKSFQDIAYKASDVFFRVLPNTH